MAKYQKKPVVIEAEQFVVYQRESKIISFTAHGMTFPVYKDNTGYHIIIPTLEGNMRCDNLDFIIKGIQGEIYPCKPDIFEKSYQPVND